MALFDDNSESRTERPTERRRRQARERGFVARSAELLGAARVLVIWILAGGWFTTFASSASSLLRDSLASQTQNPVESFNGIIQLQKLAWRSFALASWPLAAAAAAVLLAHVVQTGWLWRWENVSPQAFRLSPLAGVLRLLSLTTVSRIFGAALKFSLIVGMSAIVVAQSLPILPMTFENLFEPLSALETNVLRLVAYTTSVLLAYGCLHYAWQRWKFERSLYMTREEMREEQKELEGAPHLKRHRNTVPQRQTLTSSLATSDSNNQ